MSNRFMSFKPGATRRTQLLVAAVLWTGLGLLLLMRGIGYLETINGPLTVATVLGGSFAGCLKSYFILDTAAHRLRERIRGFDDDTCLGAVYSIKTWLMVLAMASMGALLRISALPGIFICLILFAVGSSLLLSGRIVWQAWISSAKQEF